MCDAVTDNALDLTHLSHRPQMCWDHSHITSEDRVARQYPLEGQEQLDHYICLLIKCDLSLRPQDGAFSGIIQTFVDCALSLLQPPGT